MQCFAPIQAWTTTDGGVVFVERGKNLLKEVQIRCGQCIGCRVNRAQSWTVRCVHEAQMHASNSFLTLTYDDEHLPADGSLNYRHFQAFAKKLRRKAGPFRFYMCGEYGPQTLRPHYHALVFGLDFSSDRVRCNSVYASEPVYSSPTVADCWPHGFHSIGNVTPQSAGYCAQYALKKVTGDKADEHYTRVIQSTGEIVQVEPEFSRMSLRPGIGATWFAKYGSDVWNWDNVILDGRTFPVPQYYSRLIDEANPQRFEELQFERAKRAEEKIMDNTAERLHVKAVNAKARLALKSRNLE